ncbi:MAG: asparagine synthase (glutamine-hydrolyzing) [Candidatus Howiella sp.]|jgi:asparagine synthase (glutamine-hydrolysing)
MCGIAGEVAVGHNLHGGAEAYLAMQNVLRRRGPDESGIYCDGDAVLIHDRLAVIDIEHGGQPMLYPPAGEELVLVYNGELYNTEEIRNELLQKGYRFDGHSDTEVLLKAYDCFGAACVEKLNGIFAFAVWEKKRKRLFLARDRIGVKPLFYARTGGSLLFSSEIKGILAGGKIEPRVDLSGIAEVMLIGPGRTPGCGVFAGIEEVPPACCGYFADGRLELRKYWELRQQPHTDSFEETAEHVRYLLVDAITRQLVSDVPVGTFLSGGLDSSLISSVAARYFGERGERLHTFTVDYRDNDKYFQATKFQPNSDSNFTGLMNNYLGAVSHKSVIDTPALADALYMAVEARDLPGMADVDASLLLFCGEIKKHCTVALSGECADEIFGGYPWYRDKEIRETDGFPWAQSTAYRYSFLQPDIAAKMDPESYVYSRYKGTVEAAHSLSGIPSDEKRMREMMRLNLDWFMQTLLDRKDRMSMYNALEVRVPFCDYRIAEYLYSVPWEYKDYQHYEKGLLRYAMREYLPDEVLWRKKSPYPKTHNPSYLAEVSRRLRKVIENPYAPILQIVQKPALEKLLTDSKAQPWYGQLMTTPQTIAYMLQLNYWLKKYDISVCI